MTCVCDRRLRRQGEALQRPERPIIVFSFNYDNDDEHNNNNDNTYYYYYISYHFYIYYR